MVDFPPKDGVYVRGKMQNLCRMTLAHHVLDFTMFLHCGGGAGSFCRFERVGGETRRVTSFGTMPHKPCKHFPIGTYHISMPRQRPNGFSARRCLR